MLLVIIPAIAIPVCVINFGVGTNTEENVLIFIAGVPVLILFLAPLVWLTQILTTSINVSENGLLINNIFKKIRLNWSDIEKINKVAILSSTFPSYGPPRDLELLTKNNKKVTIHFFVISNNDTENKIDELEECINLHLSKQLHA